MKLFLLPAATLLMANGAYASVRGATTEFAEVGAQWQCNMPDHSGCPRDRTEYICDDDQTACCDITFSNEEKKMRRTRKGRDNMKNLKQTVPLEGYGSCTLVDTDSSTSPDMFEFELSNWIELDEDELPEFLQLEGKCGCRVGRDKEDCNGNKVCVGGNCNTRNSGGNSGQCKNPNNSNNNSNRNNKSENCSNKSKSNCNSNNCYYSNGKCKSGSNNSNSCKNIRSKNSCKDSNNCKWKNDKCKDKSVDDVLEELIAEEDEKAAELSNGIEFVEEENKKCSRSSQCSSGEFCNNSGRCQRNNNRNYCSKQSDCVNRNDYCDYDRNECRRATGQSCKSGTDCGDGSGSVWMCRDGRCQPRSLFELAMERVMNGEGVVFDLDEAMEEE